MGCVIRSTEIHKRGDSPVFDFFSFGPPYETKNLKVVKMSSNFVRFQKIPNQAFAENFTCLSHGEIRNFHPLYKLGPS